MAMSAKSIGRFLETWQENGMGDFLRSVGKASKQDVDQIFSNAINADIKEFQEGTGRIWQRSAFVNHGANFGNRISNKTTEEWLNFGRGAGFFDNADDVYNNLAKLKGLTPVSKEEARLRFSNAGSQITPEQLATKNGFSITDDGLRPRKPINKEEAIERMKGYFGRGTAALKEREAAERAKIAQDNARDKALRTTVRREVNQYEDSVRNSSDFQEAVRANIEREKIADRQMAMYNRGVNERAQRSVTEKNAAIATGNKQKTMLDNAHKNANILQDPLAMRVAHENNLDPSDPQQVEKLRSIISTANKQGAARAAEIGSGKPLQEGTVSIPWTDTEKQAGIRNLREQPGGVKVEDSPLYDEETLLAKMGGNKKNFGYDNASKYRLKQVKQKLDDDYETIIKNGGTFNEQQAAWKKTQDEAAKMLEEGPDMADYAFGNDLHYKGLGFAAMVGLAGVAFGGAKSNAQLYSSPF